MFFCFFSFAPDVQANLANRLMLITKTGDDIILTELSYFLFFWNYYTGFLGTANSELSGANPVFEAGGKRFMVKQNTNEEDEVL